MRRVLVLFLFIAVGIGHAQAAADYANWAAIVVAGDFHAHDGSLTEAFDNARRDVSADLLRIGFAPANIEQFSVRPERYAHVAPADPETINDGLWKLTDQATAGCFVYFSSHGSPDGIVVDDTILSPDQLNDIVGNACGNRPTVVFLSACFSGVFVPALQASNRFIMTAARADRASFGCGTEDKYPYFDDCFLQSLPAVHDFPALADRTKTCVAMLEKKTGMAPPSDPQIFIGAEVAKDLPGW